MRVENIACLPTQEINVDAGYGTLEVSARSGSWYAIKIYMNTVTAGDAFLDVYLDGVQIRHWSQHRDAAPSGYYSYGWWESNLFFFTDYTFDTSMVVMTPCDIGSVAVRPFYQNCSMPILDLASDSVLFTISRGSQYLKFLGPNSILVDTISTYMSEGQTNGFDLWPTGHYPPPGVDYDTVEVKATSHWKEQIKYFQVGNPPPDHLSYDNPERYLISGDQTEITVIELNSDGSERGCDDTRPIVFSLDSTRFGHFTDTSGQTVPGSTYTALYKDVRAGRVGYRADGDVPDTTVAFHITANTAGSQAAAMTIYLNHPPDSVLVTLCPPIASPGDTVSILVQRKRWDCEIFPYPDSQRFYVDFDDWLNDHVFGQFLDSATNQVSGSLWCALKGFKFIASPDTMPQDPAHLIKFYVEALPDSWCTCCNGQAALAAAGSKVDAGADVLRASSWEFLRATKDDMIARKRTERSRLSEKRSVHRKMSVADMNPACQLHRSQGLSERIVPILLGETKYFGVKICDLDNSLIIDTTAFSGHSLDATGFLSEEIWPSEPVQCVTSGIPDGIPAGRRTGVYWEVGKSAPDYDGQTRQMPAGLIRIIGRYWGQDSVYRVRLSAKKAGYRDGRILLEIRKPVTLGNSHATVTDVFCNTISNLDSIIVRFAGEFGIPPQLIKGQMETEDANFTPVWRYEPFEDAQLQRKMKAYRYFSKDLPFVVTPTSMGSGDLPSHSCEDRYPYVMGPVKISTYTTTTENWQRYVQHHTGAEPDLIVWSEDLSDYWLELYNEFKGAFTDEDARKMAHDELKCEILDTTSDIGKPFNKIAQTRKVTSYGLTQMMYITAADNVFDAAHLSCLAPTAVHLMNQRNSHMYPEMLNEQDTLMIRYSNLLWTKLQYSFTACILAGNWDLGYESQWEKALIKYHGGKSTDTYGQTVLLNSRHYFPSDH